MQITLALLTLATVASAAIGSSPTASAPAGCSTDYSGSFEITILNSTTSSSKKAKRQSSTCGQAGYLTVTLAGGILKDSENRQGEIVANYQFQFDNPLQSGAVYTQGFSVCSNESLALGGSNVFWECVTTGGPGIGTYYNLYSQSTGAQCQPILINIIPCAADPVSSSAVVGQSSDGQPTGTSVGSVVSQATDGQPQATGTPGTVVPVSQISDGQPQATSIGTGCVVSQISDGQVQFVTSCPTPTPTPACVVSQISDGQVQITSCASTVTAAPVSQISDGQVQATTASTAVPVSQISDGQPQVGTTSAKSATTSVAVVSQISDGQPQVPNATVITATASSTPLQVTGNSATGLGIASTFAAVMVGFAAVLLL